MANTVSIPGTYVLTAYANHVVNSEAVQEASLLTTLPTYDIRRCLPLHFALLGHQLELM